MQLNAVVKRQPWGAKYLRWVAVDPNAVTIARALPGRARKVGGRVLLNTAGEIHQIGQSRARPARPSSSSGMTRGRSHDLAPLSRHPSRSTLYLNRLAAARAAPRCPPHRRSPAPSSARAPPPPPAAHTMSPAFAPTSTFAPAKPALTSSFTCAALPARTEPRHASATAAGPTMILRAASLRKPVGLGGVYKRYASGFGGADAILRKADEYMSESVLRQYYKVANPSGVYGTQCTEGGSKFMAEFARVRALNTRFRVSLSSPAAYYGKLYENRKMAIVASHECHHEESQFTDYRKVAESYNTAKEEALGTCSRYATPETEEEAALSRFMDIQQNNAANPTGVYNMACNEGAAKLQAEDCRIAALNAAFRQGQKSTVKLLQEKYDQRRKGYARTHGCNYEEMLVNKYPAIGAGFRPKTTGF